MLVDNVNGFDIVELELNLQDSQEQTEIIPINPINPPSPTSKKVIRKKPKKHNPIVESVRQVVDLDNLEMPLEERLEVLTNHATTDNSKLAYAYHTLQYNQTDAGNAKMFVDCFKGNLYFNHTSKKWIFWSHNGWKVDDVRFITQLALRAIQHRASIAKRIPADDETTRKLRQNEIQWCLRSENDKPLQQMLRMATSFPVMATTEDDWDTHRHLLGVKNGIVDLYSSKLIPEDKIKPLKMLKQCDANYLFNGWSQDEIAEDSKKAEIWWLFLKNMFTVNDVLQEDLQDFILASLGYSLTGYTNDKSFFCLYGAGDNGKSVIVNIMRGMLTTAYADIMPFSALEHKDRSQISNDIAALKGKRFIGASEVQEGVRLNEGRIKALTGDEDARARFLHENSFTFRPELKLWLAFNHKPLVTDETSSFWNRLKLLELPNCFTKSDPRRIPRLEYRLMDERDYILSILVGYAKRYFNGGLKTPDQIRENIESYRTESNPIQDFINDNCSTEDGTEGIHTVELYKAYISWCKEYNKRPLARHNFYKKMYAAGFEKVKRTEKKLEYFTGIKLIDTIGTLKGFDFSE